MFASANSVVAATNTKAEIKAVKNVLKSQIASANKYSFPDFVKHFDLQYVTSDGFSIDVYSKLVEETWAVYPNIQYAHTITNIQVMDNDAIAEVIETANAQVQSQYDLKGSLKSVANNVYFLRKTPDGWRILSDVILTENTYLAFGEMVNHLPTLTVPYQTLANRNYTATLEYSVPKDAIAIASLNQERVSYPQESMKENYRKLPEDGILERFFTANSDSTNEYIVASVGLTRPQFENNDLQIGVTGIAYIIKRVNVVPQNKFIDMTDVVPIKERLKKYSEPVQEETVEVKEVKAETVEESTPSPEVEEEKTEEATSQETSVEDVVEETVDETSSIENKPEVEEKTVEEVKTSVEYNKQSLEEDLTSEEQMVVNRVVAKQKAVEEATKLREEQEEKASKQETKAIMKAQKEKEKLEQQANREAEKLVKAQQKAEKARLKAEAKATKEAQKAEKKAEQEKIKQEQKALKQAKKEAEKVAKQEQQTEKNKQKQDLKQQKADEKKEKKLNKGAFSPDVVGIPVTATVCPIETQEVSHVQD